MKILRFCISFFLVTHFLIPGLFAQDIAVDDLKRDISVLAADSLQGRKPGTLQGLMAATYIRSGFREAGITLLGNNGFQQFEVIANPSLGKMTSMTFPGFEGVPGVNFTPLSFSENGRLETLCAFAGYGFEIHEDSLEWNDYQGLDVRGRWVVILRGDPEPEKTDSRFLAYTEERSKVLTAKDKGASGVIFVTGVGLDKKDTLVPLQHDKSGATAGIPVLNITRQAADLLLKSSAKTVADLEKTLNETRKPAGFLLPVKLNAAVQVMMQRSVTYNVMGMIEGSDPLLKDEYLVIGAHYDHLGLGGPGSGSRMPDTSAVHNGADDNASGVAGVMALARKFRSPSVKPKRSILFVAFSSEESGLIGSKHFVKNCPVDIRKVKAMFNMDMIGRLAADSGSLMVGGTGTAAETQEILERLAAGRPFAVKYSTEGYGASDHSSFYVEDIPVFFFTTGAHDDYHTPFDDAHKINYEGQQQLLGFVYDVIAEVAARDQALTFREAGPKGSQSRGARFKVTLGILPDFTGTDNNGLRIDGVKKDGPASKAGLLKGDIIVAMNGKDVRNIYEYMDRLKTLEAGQTVNIDLIRNGKKVVLLVQL